MGSPFYMYLNRRMRMNKDELYLLRRKKKITLKAIAKHLNVSISAISQYETDKLRLSERNENLYKQYILNN